jgi:hypothetical protein
MFGSMGWGVILNRKTLFMIVGHGILKFVHGRAVAGMSEWRYQ